MAKADLTAERLREFIQYDPDTGIFTRIKKISCHANRCRIGEISTTPSDNGYIRIGVNGFRYYAHRLAFLFMTGKWPDVLVDHKNRIKTDNRWSNLRQATTFENMQNIVLKKKGLSGVKGVSWQKNRGKWLVRFKCKGELIYLGYFSDLDEACNKCRDEIAKHHTHLPE